MLYVLMLQVAVAVWFINYLVSHDRGSKEPKKIIALAGAFGLLGLIFAGVLEAFVLSPDLSPSDITNLPFFLLFVNAIGIGLIEELAKALPLAIFIYKKGYFNEVTDGVIYFGIAGMIFGVVESITYSLAYGASVGIGRLILVPFFHAGISATFGILLARHKLYQTPFWHLAAGVVGIAVIHGVYDFGMFSGSYVLFILSLVITLGVNIAVFDVYKNAQKADEKLGLSAVGTNAFCRNCGHPNPNKFLFCPYCGHRT